MTLQLASLASFLLIATGLTVFGLALRKASQLMSHARGIIEAVNTCSRDLDRALAALKAERETCEKLEASLDSQLRHGRKAHSELTRTISLFERVRSQRPANNSNPPVPGKGVARTAPEHGSRPAQTKTAGAPERKLPAFVHRTVKSVHAAQKLG
jgi:hypothetical protein